MTERRGRRWATALLMAGAVVFGMVLAGSLDWTPAGWGSPADDSERVVVRSAGTLPGFADLAEAVAPAVVTIRAVSFQEAPAAQRGSGGDAPGAGPGGGGPGGGGQGENDPFFDFFFGP